MRLDPSSSTLLFVSLIAGIVILGVMITIQTFEYQDLVNHSTNILNQLIPLDIELIDHFNCQELKAWNTQILTNQQSDLSQLLLKEIKMKLYDDGC